MEPDVIIEGLTVTVPLTIGLVTYQVRLLKRLDTMERQLEVLVSNWRRIYNQIDRIRPRRHSDPPQADFTNKRRSIIDDLSDIVSLDDQDSTGPITANLFTTKGDT